MKYYRSRMVLASLFCAFLVASPAFFFAAAQDSLADSDGDGLTDWDETNRYGSRPDLVDTDGDTISDGVEVGIGMSPLSTDSDGDHYSDIYEYTNWDPDAARIEDRYRLCPYIANLPDFSIEIADESVEFDFIFQKGQETHTETVTTSIDQTTNEQSWGHQVNGELEFYAGAYARLGLMSQDFGTSFFSSGGNCAVPWPYVEIMREVGIQYTGDIIDYKNRDYSFMQLRERDVSDIYDEYVNTGWDLDSASLLAKVTLTNSYDRTVLLSKIIFDLGTEQQIYLSEPEEYDITIGQGQSYEFTVDFPVGAGVGTGGGKEWIHDLSTKKHFLRMSNVYDDISVWDDTGVIAQWVSIDVVMETVQSQCTLVEVVGPDFTVREFITSNVDRIDGLSVLDALDMLYIPYTYKYKRLLDLMGHASTPGEKVWAFAYFDIWFDPETLSDEMNFEELNMWARGALTVDLQQDTDGDWLVDNVEFRLGTNSTNPDTDGDFADDYIEIAVLRSNPFVQDTDGGGTIDGIEYYEHLNVSDPTDDKFELPEWYTNHETMQTAQSAADALLQMAIRPDEDQMTWSAPKSSVYNMTYSYEGLVTYVTNETLFQLADETILSIAIGDADNDGDNDTVVGTYPHGLVLLLEAQDNSYILHEPIGNFTEMIGEYPVSVMDVSIGNVDNVGGNEIVVGTSFFDSSWNGALYKFYGSGTTWNNDKIADVTGGVYSLEIGDVDYDFENELVVGEGAVEALPTGSVKIYEYAAGWGLPVTAAVINSSRVYVTIGEYTEESSLGVDFPGNEIIYCTYSLNSTLGYIGCDYIQEIYYNYPLYVLTHLQTDVNWEKYMWIGLGNSKGVETELVAAIDSSVPDNDHIEIIEPSPQLIVGNLQFPSVFDELIFDDIDNDGWDEILYLNSSVSTFPNTNLTIWDYNGSSYVHIPVETPESHISGMAAGDVNSDGENEFLYGTDLLKLWSLPEGALWPGERMEWNYTVTLLEPWIYQGERYPVTVDVETLGDYEINNLNVSLLHNAQINGESETLHIFDSVALDSIGSIVFDLLPLSGGNFTLDIYLNSTSPRISHHSQFSILIRSRTAYQVEIGQALLDLAIATNNETLLEAAMQVGNWLDAVKMDLGLRNVAGSVPDNDFLVFSQETCAWNGDANYTDTLLQGNILSTVKIARFLLNLYNATHEYDPYLDTAILASYYLANSSVFLQKVPYYECATSWTPESIIEIAEIGSFLKDINKEFLYDFFSPTITGLANHLCRVSQDYPASSNWLGEPGLTQSASRFLAQLEVTEISAFNYTEYSLGAGEWLVDYAETFASDLSTSVRCENPYQYHNETGLAGISIGLADMRDIFDLDYSEVMDVIGDNILSREYVSSQGCNWDEKFWTPDVDLLAHASSWDYGASGISVALAEIYKETGNQTYRETFLDSAKWIQNSIDEMILSPCGCNQIATLADAIRSMIYIHSVLPVIFVGYFVDPMTSLSGYKFTLSGYVQTIGWHANNVSLTVDLPAVFLLSADQNRTIHLGCIRNPGTAVVTWDLYLLRYGDYEITITGNSTNAGSQTNTAGVTVTDLGVEKIPWDSDDGLTAFKVSSAGYFALQVPDELTETLYNIGEQVVIPVEAQYAHTNGSAYNASIQVGDYGTAVVNASGVGYAVVTEWEPGIKEIPISIRYDKQSGITDGTSNLTLTMTFSSLEIVQANVSTNLGQTGQQVTFQGLVCYGHDGSPIAGATVALNGVVKTVTDANGHFTFEHSEATPGIVDYEIAATSDGENRIIMASLNQTIQVEWVEFWTPTTTLLFVGGTTALVVVLIVGFRRLKGGDVAGA
ncbi:MAG: hypothetical protein RTV31_11065 [Candidatus Thorarchaeota archaeon]